jgi:TrmH family RNA methyltransferase
VRQVRAGRDKDHVLFEGHRVVGDALAAGVLPLWVLCDSDELAAEMADKLAVAAEKPHSKYAKIRPEVLLCSTQLLREVSDLDTPAGPLAMAFRPFVEVEPVLERVCRSRGSRLILAAAGVQDPGNVGALVRVAAGLGAEALISLKGGASPWHPRALRGASGTTFRLPVPERVSESDLFSLAMDLGIEVWGADGSGEALSAFAQQRAAIRSEGKTVPPMILLMGEEGRGLSEKMRKSCTGTLAISLTREVESLNVATAAAVLVHALVGAGAGQKA